MHTRLDIQHRTDQFKLACMSLNKDNSEVPEFPTFYPVTHSERPPLHQEWQAEEEEAAKRNADIAERSLILKRPPKGREWLVAGVKKSCNSQAPPALAQKSLSVLLAQQELMKRQSIAVEEARKRSERSYIKLAGRTQDLSGGAFDDLLRRARALAHKPTTAISD